MAEPQTRARSRPGLPPRPCRHSSPMPSRSAARHNAASRADRLRRASNNSRRVPAGNGSSSARSPARCGGQRRLQDGPTRPARRSWSARGQLQHAKRIGPALALAEDPAPPSRRATRDRRVQQAGRVGGGSPSSHDLRQSFEARDRRRLAQREPPIPPRSARSRRATENARRLQRTPDRATARRRRRRVSGCSSRRRPAGSKNGAADQEAIRRGPPLMPHAVFNQRVALREWQMPEDGRHRCATAHAAAKRRVHLGMRPHAYPRRSASFRDGRQ